MPTAKSATQRRTVLRIGVIDPNGGLSLRPRGDAYGEQGDDVTGREQSKMAI